MPGYGTSAKLRPVCRGTMAAVGMVKQDGAGETIYDEGGVPAWAFVLVEVVALTKNRFAFRAVPRPHTVGFGVRSSRQSFPLLDE